MKILFKTDKGELLIEERLIKAIVFLNHPVSEGYDVEIYTEVGLFYAVASKPLLDLKNQCIAELNKDSGLLLNPRSVIKRNDKSDNNEVTE